MNNKDLAIRIYEQAVHDAEKTLMIGLETEPEDVEPATEPEKVKPRETAADRRNFYRKQAGWPLLKEK